MARILVVDGDERFRSACAEDLEHEGHEVLTASTGAEALRVAEARVPDMVITEVQLPGMDGLDLMSRLLASHRRIIVILNSATSCYKDNFLSWAADAYVNKSPGSLELRARVRELLNPGTAATRIPTPQTSLVRVSDLIFAPHHRQVVHH